VGSTRTADHASSRGGQLGALATVALWCGSFALIKHLVDSGLAAQDIAIGRFAVAWPGFAYLLWRAGGLPGLRRGDALRILVAAAGGVTAYHLALNAGERTTASGVAALIVALGPAATLALALAVGLESFAPRRMAGIALAFAGVVVVVLGSGAHFSLHGLRGPLLVLVAPLTFALYNILYKPLLARFDLPALTAAGGIAGSLMFLPFENGGAVDRFGALEAGGWIALVALGLGATFGGYVTWSIALRGLEPSRAMSYLYCVPPLAVAIGAVALGERITGWLVLGGALVIGGVAIAQRGTLRAAPRAPDPCVEVESGQPW
jgi:drug/metabolite transporter (DMT)-like permease